MPRGSNPNSLKNLDRNQFTPEQRKAIASKAGKASAEARKARASLTDAMVTSMTPEIARELAQTAIKRAHYNPEWFKIVRDQIGEKPADKIVVAEISPEVIADVENIVNSYDT